MSKIININVAEMAVGYNDTHIRTGGIGSCVVIVLYDPSAKVGGMAHAMLPARMRIEGQSFDGAESELSVKYADEAIDSLVKAIEAIGGKKERMKAKLIGGARMFKFLEGEIGAIGHQNTEAAKKRLQEMNILIESEDIGGTVGRIAEFNLETGLVEVTTKM